MRILVGVGAWLLGAGAATAGSLLAVSLLGQGIADTPTQQLTTDAVKSALAVEAHETSPSDVPTTSRPPVPTSPVTRAATSRPPVIQAAPATPSPTPAVSRKVASPSPQAASGTVLTSAGGTVLAECQSAGAYLVSWSPTQGYEATGVVRGPAATARVIFESNANSVTMVVTCAGGTPTVTSSLHGGDDGGGDE